MAISAVLDTGIVRSYIDSNDSKHAKTKKEIDEYFDLHTSFILPSACLTEISFWLNNTKNQKFIKDQKLQSFLKSKKIKIFELGASYIQLIFDDWTSFCNQRRVSDFCDIYVYLCANFLSSDYIFTTDEKDFEKILSNTKDFKFNELLLNRKRPFNHDNILIIR